MTTDEVGVYEPENTEQPCLAEIKVYRIQADEFLDISLSFLATLGRTATHSYPHALFTATQNIE
jgi:hypothetical protein